MNNTWEETNFLVITLLTLDIVGWVYVFLFGTFDLDGLGLSISFSWGASSEVPPAEWLAPCGSEVLPADPWFAYDIKTKKLWTVSNKEEPMPCIRRLYLAKFEIWMNWILTTSWIVPRFEAFFTMHSKSFSSWYLSIL